VSSGPPAIDERLARRLVDAQFPRWRDLPVVPVAPGGVDNRTFRLGDELSVRLPSADWYALQVEKEQRWLPVLAPRLPLPIPQPVAQGRPGEEYPYPWSVHRWLEGQTASRERVADLPRFAEDLAAFLTALARVPAGGGPGPGPHNFHRGGPLAHYERETLAAIDALRGEIDAAAARACWADAMASSHRGAPVWFHGDVAVGNLLVRDGRLAAVIDFGTSGVGDPACDVVIAWTFLEGASRAVFRRALGVDDATWSRGRGWALWKALITVAGGGSWAADARVTLDRVLDEFGTNP
jgi:aminoglycoside phosphotransferase (APT) family kinase protein